MTPRQETDLQRSVGRIEGTLEHVVATLQRVEERSSARDVIMESVLARLEATETHGHAMSGVADAFHALQQSIRDGKMQAKGVLIGIGVAGGAAGATAATGLKWLWAALTGA